ncbi:helix-turn-helix domain-containing protein [Rhodococcus sp. KBS0724]|jgi:DNA-binding IclR family transcriptional regulator|uniref:IclR family transcriptional regulator n=1 Tax=Rhodococcus sp. KBS0724 TaxID=1179674 RepID=UPI00110E4811|nr:helix-turn-helix domain-containing protein [Rhodococcus sp. KBS0724]TSD49596.1 helix-turn-helix domain-containing protein [Rhodococcus sp. KBS0724]
MTIQSTIDRSTPSAFLDRVSLLLDTFDGSANLTLAQIVRRTGLPRSSAHRMLEHLVQLRWLQRDGHDYTLGLRLMELGSLAVRQDRLHSAIIPHLHELHRATGLAVQLAALDGDELVYHEYVGGRLAGAVPNRVGSRDKADQVALGRILLAYNGASGESFDRLRETGIACERHTPIEGFGSIAAPIGPIGSATSALSLSGPSHQLPLNPPDPRLTEILVSTATAVWRRVNNHVVPTLQRSKTLRSTPHGLTLR